MNKNQNQKKMKKFRDNLLRKKINKRVINKIKPKYNDKNITIFRIPKSSNNSNNSLINKTYNNYHHSLGKQLSNRQKIVEELSKFSKENRNFFNNALHKHVFNMEVYIPQNLTKKEYANKNYFINQLINVERMSENTKKIIGPLQKETTNFSKYYELIKSGNNDYMNNVKKLYQLKGYKKNDEYKNNEKIFDSSFLLDKKYGKDHIFEKKLGCN